MKIKIFYKRVFEDEWEATAKVANEYAVGIASTKELARARVIAKAVMIKNRLEEKEPDEEVEI